jgi:hypothetical protein
MAIRRSWHEVLENSLRDGACPSCGHAIPGRWTNAFAPGQAAALAASEKRASKYGALNL